MKIVEFLLKPSIVLTFIGFNQRDKHLIRIAKPQHGNGPKSDFESVSYFFQEYSEIPQKLKSVEGFPNILIHFWCTYI